MRTILITEKRHKGKQLDVTRYVKTATGVDIRVTHNIPATAGKQLRWVQTVTENGSFFNDCGRRTAVDPFSLAGAVALPGLGGVCKADDLKPFYWTDGEFTGPDGPFFSDVPSEGVPASGRAWINFVLALTEVTGKKVHHLVAMTWGFDRLADGAVKVSGIHRARMTDMKRHGMALKKMYPGYVFT